ncbi:hypothetical protein D3C87_2035760 [compost metagenome]
MIRQQIQMFADNQSRFVESWRLFCKLRKLDQQTVAQIFCCDADRVKALNALEDGFDLVEFNFAITHAFQNLVQSHR